MAVAFSSVRVESSRDTKKTGIFLNFFLEFFQIFLTTFDLVLSTKCETFDFLVHFFVILLFTFHTQNWVKSGQNRPKFKNSENWEKIQFFYVSTTFAALELVAPAQIEKKWIFFVLHV